MTLEGFLFVFGSLLVIVVLPFVLGHFLARLLRLKDFGTRISVVLLVVSLGIAPFAAQGVQGTREQQRYEAELAEWERRGREFQVTDEGLQRLREALPQEVRFVR